MYLSPLCSPVGPSAGHANTYLLFCIQYKIDSTAAYEYSGEQNSNKINDLNAQDEDFILVRTIDGLQEWTQVLAREIDEETYEILDCTEYHHDDNSVLFEFYPGDIVHVGYVTMPLEDDPQAIRLVQTGQWPKRDYFLFQYKVMKHTLPSNLALFTPWLPVIDTIRKEMNEGIFFYRHIREFIQHIFNP